MRAMTTSPTTRGDLFGAEVLRVSPPERDKNALCIEARRAERVLAVALDRLGKVIEAVPQLHLGADIDLVFQLINFFTKLEVLGSHLRQFQLQVGGLADQISDERMQLCIVEFLRQLAKSLDDRDYSVHRTQGIHHGLSWYAIELLHIAERGQLPCTDQLQDIALAMLQQDAGLYPEPDGPDLVNTPENAPAGTGAREEGS